LVRSLPVQFRFLCLVLLGAVALGLAGCGDSDRFTYATETDEPNYREGQSLLKAGRRQEALTAFLKVIDRRRDDAPESHLEVGLLYVQHINDPLSAIYHFRKYLAQRPNSQQAPLVRQRIDAAIREFARTIPAQPLENQGQRVDLIATLDRLKQENESLKQQLAEARAARGNPVQLAENNAVVPTAVAPSAGPNNLTFSVETGPTVRTHPNPSPPPSRPQSNPVVAPARQTMQPAAPARSTTATPAPATVGRKHVVRPGDTLVKLAQQYYNNRAKWRDIYAANRNVMKNEADLKVGMELKIP
jgi:tetratricopeptide (TPR) repeat protein